MCYCNPFENTHPFSYAFSEQSRQHLRKKLKGNLQKRELKLAKHILLTFLEETATQIFKNGKIYTMDGNKTIADTIALKNNKILKVGKYDDVILFATPKTQIVDLEGRTMLPGFIDPHVHMCFCMLDHWLDLGPFINKDLAQVKTKLIEAIKKADKNYLLCAQLFDPKIMKGQLDVGIKALDEISKEVGLFILQANGHVAHVNTAGFKLLGIDKNTPDPPHGRLLRDADGELTGQVQETAVGLFKTKFLPISPEQYQQNFHNFLQRCASKGCTTLHDCGIGYIDAKADLSLLISTFNENPPVRYSGMLVSTQVKTWQQYKLTPNNYDPYLRINGVKCWVDGSTQSGSAFLRQNYLKQKWGKGHANYTKQVLYKTVSMAHNQNWQVGIHCNGDAGIDMALDVYEQVQKQNPKPQLRHRIQHSTICHKQHLQRMKRLNVYPSFLIGHIYYYGHVFQKVLGNQRANLTDPLKSAFHLGLKPTIHSDYNCQPVDPLRCIYNAVTRKIKATGQVLNPQECISPYKAVMAMTINAAFQCHMEDIVGSLEQGKYADFVILEENPMTVNNDEIINIKIHSTWMDGEIRYKGSKKDLKTKKIDSFDLDKGKYQLKQTQSITKDAEEKIKKNRSKSRSNNKDGKLSPRQKLQEKNNQKLDNIDQSTKELKDLQLIKQRTNESGKQHEVEKSKIQEEKEHAHYKKAVSHESEVKHVNQHKQQKTEQKEQKRKHETKNQDVSQH